MLVDLNKIEKEKDSLYIELVVDERLPKQVGAPFTANCMMIAKRYSDYTEFSLDIEASLKLICQRCCDSFDYSFAQKIMISVCETEEMANKYMDLYECIVSPRRIINLKDIVTDTCHLYLPEAHIKFTECNLSIQKYLINTSEN